MKTMKVVAVSDIRQDKNGREYKLVTLSNPSKVVVPDPETGEVYNAHVQPLKSSVTAYKESYLDNTPDFLWAVEEGEIVLGEVVTRKVNQYTIENEGVTREVSAYTCAVLGDSSDEGAWTMAIARAFKRNGHELEGESSEEEAPKKEVSIIEEDATVEEEAPMNF